MKAVSVGPDKTPLKPFVINQGPQCLHKGTSIQILMEIIHQATLNKNGLTQSPLGVKS